MKKWRKSITASEEPVTIDVARKKLLSNIRILDRMAGNRLKELIHVLEKEFPQGSRLSFLEGNEAIKLKDALDILEDIDIRLSRVIDR